MARKENNARQKSNRKTTDLNPTTLVIASNISGQNSPIKTKIIAGCGGSHW